MKLSNDEFMKQLKSFIGDRTDDEAIKFIEDCKDTITADKDDWKQKYDDVLKEKEDLDAEWRKKYTERFFAADTHTDDTKDETKNTPKAKNPAHVIDDVDEEEQKRLEQAEKIRCDDLFKPVTE